MPLVDPTELLQQLVRIPSVNPVHRAGGAEPTSGEPKALEKDQFEPRDIDIYSEGRLTDFLEKWCGALGLAVFRQPVLPGRDNLIVRLLGHPPPEQGGHILLWDAHQDTVPPGRMAHPFAGQIRQGHLYGRGACDVKGGMAAMLAALARLAPESANAENMPGETKNLPASRGKALAGRTAPKEPARSTSASKEPSARPTVYLVATVDEEHGMSGVRAVCQLWETSTGDIFPRRPDAAIVAEPTNLQVIVAHKGVVRWRCHTLGQACHSSRPHEGVNAIYLMAELLQALQQYAGQMVPHLGWHPLCGSGSLSVGRIYGGQSVNIVPDCCTIEIDRRLLPGQSPQEAWEHCLKYLVGCLSQPDRLEQDPPWPPIPPLSDRSNGQLAEKLTRLVSQITGQECRRLGADYATHAGFYAQAGIPTVVFGPGSIHQAHTAEEWIALEQLHQAAEVFYQLVITWYSP